MKKTAVLALVVLTFFLLFSASDVTPQSFESAKTENITENIFVEVNPNVELVNIVFSLTNQNELLEQAGFSPIKSKYTQDISQYFAPYKNHRTVKLAQNLMELLGLDGPTNFSLYFSAPPELKKKCEYSEEFLQSKGVEKVILDEFADALRNFSGETKFMEFYNSHEEFYQEIIQDAEKRVDLQDIVKTVESFFGTEREEYHLVLMPSAPFGGGFGPHLPTGEIYCLIYPLSLDAQTPQIFSQLQDKMTYYLVLHEFSHSFINPTVEKYITEFENYSYLIEPYLEKFGTQIVIDNESVTVASYGGLGFFPELLDRASNAYIAEQKGEWLLARGILGAGGEGQGFYFIRDMYDLFEVYEANRDKYPDFDSFIPVIINELDNIEQSEEINPGEIIIIAASMVIVCLEAIWLIKTNKEKKAVEEKGDAK
jgi:hypothetical protein